MIFVGGYHDPVCVGLKCEILALGIFWTILGRSGRGCLKGLKRTISVIVVEKVALVALGQIFFYEFEAELASVLYDRLELALGEQAVDLGDLGDLLHFFHLGDLLTWEQVGPFLVLLLCIVGGGHDAMVVVLHHWQIWTFSGRLLLTQFRLFRGRNWRTTIIKVRLQQIWNLSYLVDRLLWAGSELCLLLLTLLQLLLSLVIARLLGGFYGGLSFLEGFLGLLIRQLQLKHAVHEIIWHLGNHCSRAISCGLLLLQIRCRHQHHLLLRLIFILLHRLKILLQLRCSFHTDCLRGRLVVNLGDLLMVLRLMQLLAVLVRIKGRVVLRLDLAGSRTHGTLYLKSVVHGLKSREGGGHLNRSRHWHAFNLFVANHLVIISL